MLKSKKFILEKPKRSEGWAKFQEWNLKWNKMFAIIFCILCFILLFAIVIVNIVNNSDKNKKIANTHYVNNTNAYKKLFSASVSKRNEVNTREVKKICLLTKCDMKCENGRIATIANDINEALDLAKCVLGSFTLVINGYRGPVNHNISNNWFTEVNERLFLNEFSLTSSDIKIIEDYSFNTTHFADVHTIHLTQLKLGILTSNIFYGLNNVVYMQIEGSKFNNIEKDVLSPMKSTITNLQIEDYATFSMDNFTGNAELIKMSEITLRYNNLEDKLNENSFKAVRYLVSLILLKNGITFLHKDTFAHFIGNLFKQLLIQDNFLTTLSTEIFNPIVKNPIIKIDITSNPLVCDCRLSDLQMQILDHQNAFKNYNKITCTYPGSSIKVIVIDILDICNDTLTTTTINDITSTTDIITTTEIPITIPPSPTIPTTEDPIGPIDPKLIKLSCINLGNSEYNNPKIDIPIYLRSQSNQFKIYENFEEKVYIKIENVCEDLVLIWFNNATEFQNLTIPNNSNHGCFTNVSKQFLVPNIKKSSSYIFCLMLQSETVVSPLNCAPYLSHRDDQTFQWISDLMIGLVCGGFLLFASLGALVVFCILSKCPQICRKTKKQRKRSHEPIEDYNIPPLYEHPTYSHRPNITARPPFNRSISDSSLGSARSYVSAVTPSPFQIISWRMNRTQINNQKQNNFYMEKLPDSPPPLPPHPNRRSNDSNTSIDPLCSLSFKVGNNSKDKSYA